mmetsp:Transcript_51718/g.155222  ORF Transcript_51718/g.155222 Transcript_51718/m.155222 type:complete len:562 (-) Transcript_51718:2561-4246(-)
MRKLPGTMRLLCGSLAVATPSLAQNVLVEYFDEIGRADTLVAASRVSLDLKNRHVIAAELVGDQSLLDLKRNPHIKHVEHDAVIFSIDEPVTLNHDTVAGRNRHLTELVTDGIKMIQADQIEEGTDIRTLCIVDSGIGIGHPDLPTYPTVQGVNLTLDDGTTYAWSDDATSHGTLLAGYAAAIKGNSLGVRGVANEPVRLFITRGLRDDGKGTLSMMLDAVDQCIDHGVDAISLSLGCPCRANEGCFTNGCYSEIMEDRFRSIVRGGTLVFAAAGNTGEDIHFYPASYRDIISVSAVNKDGSKWNGSNRNNQIELAALGEAAMSTAKIKGRFTYASLSGTSAATAYVAASAVLLWSNFPECSATAIRQALDATALNTMTETGCDSSIGFGIVQVKNAFDMLQKGCHSRSAMFAVPSNFEDGICKAIFEVPSTIPSPVPTQHPSSMPTQNPSGRPTQYQSERPSSFPTGRPSLIKSEMPTMFPTSISPTLIPTSDHEAPSTALQPPFDNIFLGQQNDTQGDVPNATGATNGKGRKLNATEALGLVAFASLVTTCYSIVSIIS